MMTPSFSANDRLLVFAPHPDDETLAAGELIQVAHAAGASVRVVFVTDGDNNPWPQRWLERRWRIGDVERARWGARRRGEAGEALSRLGLDVQHAQFLNWPDQGLTDRLMHDDRAVDRLVEVMSASAPTHVVLPTLADRHPDHSALRVMLELALMRCGFNGICLGYVVHALEKSEPGHRSVADTERQRRKQWAMQAYVSQMSLSRRRLLALAARTEKFEVTHASMPAPHGASPTILIPYRARAHRHHELLLVVATCREIRRWRVPLPHTHTHARDPQEQAVAIDWNAGNLGVTLPVMAEPILAVFSKVNRRGPRLLIFDHEPWYESLGTQTQAQISQHPMPAGALRDA